MFITAMLYRPFYERVCFFYAKRRSLIIEHSGATIGAKLQKLEAQRKRSKFSFTKFSFSSMKTSFHDKPPLLVQVLFNFRHEKYSVLIKRCDSSYCNQAVSLQNRSLDIKTHRIQNRAILRDLH